MIIPKNQNILTYLQDNKQRIIAPCNGKGTCGKCKIIITSKPSPNVSEMSLLSKDELAKGIRLACTRITTSPTEIELFLTNQNMEISSNIITNYSPNPYIRIDASNDIFSVYRGNKLITTKKTKKAYGISIDIGTTTVALVLIDLINMIEVETVSFINPQGSFGSDVISRIQYASTKEKLNLLSTIITEKIDEEIIKLLANNAIAHNDLYEVVIAANTTMNHILLNVDPSQLAVSPYKSVFLNTVVKEYSKVFPSTLEAIVTVLGGFDTYVGGDIVSGVYSLDLHKKEHYNILVDLGTNGEIIIANKDHIYGASTAAGPAFEAVNIQCGVGAIPGAISKYEYGKTPITINNEAPIGICGSGLIDIVSELFTHSHINKPGYMKEKFFLTNDIFLSPKDVRELQLAKSSIRAGIELLMKKANINPSNIDNLYIAGGFGKHVNVNNLYNIGIIPKNLKDKAIIVGNSSLSGAVKFLCQPLSDEIESLRHKCDIVNLGTSQEFQDLFIKYISF